MADFLASLQVNQRWTTLLGYSIVCAMMACFMVSVVQVGQALSPGWEGNYLVVLGVLFALEAFIVFHVRKDYTVIAPEWFIFHITEWVVLLVVTKIFQLSAHGAGFFLNEVHAWRENFFAAFFNSEFQILLLVLIIVWVICLLIARPLDVLRVDEKQLQIEAEVGMSQERAVARRQIMDIVLAVGVLMVVITSMLRNDLTRSWFNLPAMRLGVVNVVIYFALGLVLLSLTQFTVLHMRWSVNRVFVNPRLTSRWVKYSVIFLLILAAMTLILPTGYTRNILMVLSWLAQAFLALLFFIYWLLTLPILLIGALLSSLAGKPANIQYEPIPLVPPMEQTPTPDGLPGILGVVRTIFFFALIIGLVVYSFYYFFKVRRSALGTIPRLTVIDWLVSVWVWIASLLRGVSTRIVSAVREGVQKLISAAPRQIAETEWRYLKLRGLTSRQRVIFYYLALVRRGEESGKPRRPSQTPYEYAISLSAAMDKEMPKPGPQPAPDVDIHAITDNFIQAKYSRHEISLQQADEVHNIWKRLRKLLRREAGSQLRNRREVE